MNGPSGSGVDSVVRTATPDELDAAGDVVLAAYQAEDLGLPEYRATLRQARERARDAEIAVAVDSVGRVLGSVTFVTPGSRWAELSQDGEAEFRMLGVHPQARGRGVGAALVEWCLTRAADLGHRRVVICSAVSMHEAAPALRPARLRPSTGAGLVPGARCRPDGLQPRSVISGNVVGGGS